MCERLRYAERSARDFDTRGFRGLSNNGLAVAAVRTPREVNYVLYVLCMHCAVAPAPESGPRTVRAPLSGGFSWSFTRWELRKSRTPRLVSLLFLSHVGLGREREERERVYGRERWIGIATFVRHSNLYRLFLCFSLHWLGNYAYHNDNRNRNIIILLYFNLEINANKLRISLKLK